MHACTAASILAPAARAQARRVTDRDDELGMRVHMGRAVREPGDLVIPLRDGVMDESHIAGEIGEVLTGACEGRQCDSQVILRPASGIGALRCMH